MTTPSPPHVAILMAVYNGAANLQDQLDSLAGQDHPDWHLISSDDASTDDSPALLEEFSKAHPVTCLAGPCRGGAENFMSLIRRAPDHGAPGHWLAFCDQDDVWLPDRLSRGIAALRSGDPEQPALYCSRTWITDEHLRNRRLSAPRPRPLSFRNALVQNIASGNTILLNPAAATLIEAAARKTGPVVVHDWWIYQLVTGVGGRIVHDDQPTLLYRQHAVNQIGANDTRSAQIKRIWQLLRGSFRDWNETNIKALSCVKPQLTPENQQALVAFADMRCGLLPARLVGLRRLGLYRQSLASTLALWVSVLLKRI